MSETYLIERHIEIDAGHRVTYHGSKCRNLHGHRYKILAVCRGSLVLSGAEQGMVMDFEFLKEEMMQAIHHLCDHAMILWAQDDLAHRFLNDPARMENEVRPALIQKGFYHTDQSLVGALYLMDAVPTAENLAAHWFHRLQPRIKIRTKEKAQLLQIKVFETPNCAAVYPA